MPDLTEKDLFKVVNAKKLQAKPKGFAKVNDSISTTVKVIDSIEPSPIAEPPATLASLIEPLKQSLEASQAALASMQLELAQIKAEKEQTEKQLHSIKETSTTLQQELEEAKKESKVLADLGKLMGKSLSDNSPQPLTINGIGSPEMRAYEKLLSTTESHLVRSSLGYTKQQDLRAANSYWATNKKAISEGVGQVLKEAGFLQGSNRIVNAPTLVSDIPSVAFTYLSNFIRNNTYDDLIFAQFFNRSVSPGTPPNLNTAVPNYPYLARPTAINSRQLTPGTVIFDDSNPITERNILVTIEEWGLGRDVNNLPLGITNFVQAFSMANLEQLVMRNLGYDYQAYLDLRAYSHLFATTTRYYPGQTGSLITNTANLTANDGVLTRGFLINLFARLKADKTAAFQNGCYAYLHNPGSWAQYATTLSQQERFVDSADIQRVTTLLQLENDGYGGLVSGYKGTHDGFMHFTFNSISVGAAASTGVNSITVATVPTLFDSSFALGADTMCMVESLPVEIRRNEVTDYARRDTFIWYAHCGTAEMNVNANSTTGTERRVVEIRNKRTI
jgi:hypothetical protein